MSMASQAIRQIAGFHKNIFDLTFNALMSMGEKNEDRICSLIDRSWMSQESKESVQEWVKGYRKGWSDFKNNVDKNYASFIDNLEDEKDTGKRKQH